MTTNNTILMACDQILIDAELGYPIAFHGIPFSPPPATGVWLQVTYLPNEGIQQGIGNDATVIEQGIYQVMACRRIVDATITGGVTPLQSALALVAAEYPKGKIITGLVRVQRSPYQSSLIEDEDRMMIPLTIQYSR
jgi:hypothetical protein